MKLTVQKNMLLIGTVGVVRYFFRKLEFQQRGHLEQSRNWQESTVPVKASAQSGEVQRK